MEDNYLEHHGIIGQKWYIRRFQNGDGSYTSEGYQRRYGKKRDYESPDASKKESSLKGKTVKSVSGSPGGGGGGSSSKTSGKESSIKGKGVKSIGTGSKSSDSAVGKFKKVFRAKQENNESDNNGGKSNSKKSGASDSNNTSTKKSGINSNDIGKIGEGASKISKQILSNREKARTDRANNKALAEAKTKTNQELQEFITRRNLENAYANLRKNDSGYKEKATKMDKFLKVVDVAGRNAKTAYDVAEFIRKLR